ncbi:type IX secretion system membrane protein PorP/SprF [Salibacteraceae bacterium]|nr:type IX secretion system membrane protein PorP/SprF [Salibacteraceae bacterium]
MQLLRYSLLTLFTFLILSGNLAAQLDFSLLSSIESPIYLNAARAGETGTLRLNFNRINQYLNLGNSPERALLTADWNFKDSKYSMAITGSIDLLSDIDRYNLGLHLIRRQRLFDQIDLSLSIGFDQTYQRLDFWYFYRYDPYQPIPAIIEEETLNSYGLTPNASFNIKYKSFSTGLMYNGGPSFLTSNLGYKLSPRYWLPSHLLTAFAEYTILASEELEIHPQLYLRHRTFTSTVLSLQLRARYKWAVVRLGYRPRGDGSGDGSGMAGAGVHFRKNDFLLMLHQSINRARVFGPTFEISYVRNLKAVN